MTRRLTRRHGRSSAGQAMVELALGLPLLLVVVFAVIDFGRAYSIYVTLSNAAREGARYGVVSPTDSSGINTQVKNTAGPYNDSNLTVTSSEVSTSQSGATSTQSCASGNYVSVTAQYSLSLITPLSGFVKLISATTNIASSWTLKPTAVMCVEGS